MKGARIFILMAAAAPFIRDGKTGMGGYDLYISQLGINDQWQTAENMGNGINSAG